MMMRRSVFVLFSLMVASSPAFAWQAQTAPAVPPVQAESELGLNSLSVLVVDQATGLPLIAKNAKLQTPIASITKLMTAMVTLDAGLSLDERISITSSDIDYLKGTGSRLSVGSSYSREQLLHLALIASENRAAHALGRSYPGGIDSFVEAMNRKARQLGMHSTLYVDPTGLSSYNQSTAEDLARLANHAYHYYPEIRNISSSGNYHLGKQRVVVKKRRKARVFWRDVAFANTNRLTRDSEWQIGLSKTGYINEAGHCLLMQADIAERKVIIVLLDALGKYARLGDANRIKQWLEENIRNQPRSATVSRDT
jgi:D-alanyl-D-alanine endopeptidase (penicillin-binding protein 7)